MTNDKNLLELITTLRLLIGYLGEKDQHGWWQSAFFSPSSSAFLAPLFIRTQLLAQCNGVTRAASLLHDERIGTGNVYHLFRLPESLEQGIHNTLQNHDFASSVENSFNPQLALDCIRELAINPTSIELGPVRIGTISDLYTLDKWKQVAGFYIKAMLQDFEIYPFFSELL